MLFSSIIFLYFYLPLVLLAYYIVGKNLRNSMLLLASLFFYAWGETIYVLILIGSICMNYIIGLSIQATIKKRKSGSLYLSIGILLNLLPLFFFKYYVFMAETINAIILNQPAAIHIPEIHLPIGISFFTFQAISYLVDVYRGDADIQRNPLKLALYISLFPQLIAGPIVRYQDVYKQISHRQIERTDFEVGILRFVVGLGKKVLIANNIGLVADHIFSLPMGQISSSMAWLGIIAYTLQIYFDFSGYSDMAIGLGRMFGFKFLENFNYPYISQSIREFWQRWHISLSSWFRDYLYIPLGGNRCSAWRTYFNLITVFFLCGLWHGASWTFIAWGLFHGFFIALERTVIGKYIAMLPRPIRHCYVLLVVMIGWVFFRAENIEYALNYIQTLFRFYSYPYIDGVLSYAISTEFYWALTLGLIISTPAIPALSKWSVQKIDMLGNSAQVAAKSMHGIVWMSFMVFVIIYSSTALLSGTHNPFLYFRF